MSAAQRMQSGRPYELGPPLARYRSHSLPALNTVFSTSRSPSCSPLALSPLAPLLLSPRAVQSLLSCSPLARTGDHPPTAHRLARLAHTLFSLPSRSPLAPGARPDGLARLANATNSLPSRSRYTCGSSRPTRSHACLAPLSLPSRSQYMLGSTRSARSHAKIAPLLLPSHSRCMLGSTRSARSHANIAPLSPHGEWGAPALILLGSPPSPI